MNTVAVVGGVYGEECAFPLRKQIFGSAGRAAIALSSCFESVTLRTLIPDHVASRVLPIFDSQGVNVVNLNSDQFISFEYLHCLADPQIYPRTNKIRQQTPFHVESELVVQFGMMECQPTIDAEICVYDPQSPTNPLGFKASGSKARRLAFVANAGEIELLTGLNIDDGACQLLISEAAEVVIVKCGLHGARIFDRSGFVGSVPAFQAENVFTIGSGDIFVAAFAMAWGKHGLRPFEAAEFASRSVASYVESENCPLASIEEVLKSSRKPVELKGGVVYLAGPFRELGQRVLVNEARKALLSLGMSVFSPVHDIGHGPANFVVAKDLQAIRDCDAVFAILNGSSPGTLFEVGYAVALGKPVYCVGQNMRPNDTKLPEGAGCRLHSDLISATHLLAWRA
jgi:Nucleoside 2-deoxyribosyltransferase/pfkB family carbohydrate kinase